MPWRISHFEELDSTNRWLVERARAGEAEGRVAVADFQTAGRGRRDRKWEAASGSSLLCSLLFRPQRIDGCAFWTVALVSLAIVESLESLADLHLSLKWPNDVVSNDYKIAGLLSELVVNDDGVALVVGAGVNLSGPLPEHTIATNVEQLSGRSIDAGSLLDAVLEKVALRRELLNSDAGVENLAREYRRRVATIGQRVRVHATHDVFEGDAFDVDLRGALLVRDDSTVRVFEVGDVVHVRRGVS